MKMTGSPVFHFNSNSSKKQKIQRKLNFEQDLPRSPFQLHVNNSTAKSDIINHVDDLESRLDDRKSSDSFVFEGARGVKRKLDFDVDESSDKQSSLKFSSHNISLCGFQSKNSSLADGKSIQSKFQDSTRSSTTSTCRRRLFNEHEPNAKRARFESPVLVSKTKKKEVKLSLQKKFPGLLSSDVTRSGLMLNLALSKYNLLNDENEKDVSIGFVDDRQNRSTNKQDYVYCSSITKKENEIGHSPVFKAIKKVKRRLDLEDHELVGDRSAAESLQTNKIGLEQKSRALMSPTLFTKSTDDDKNVKDRFENLTMRSGLKNEVASQYVSNTLSSLIRGRRFDSYYRQKLDVNLTKSSSSQRKCNRTAVNSLTEDKLSKKWSFSNSLARKKQIELRKSLYEHQRESYLNERMQRYLKDCVNAAREGFIEPEIDQAFNRGTGNGKSQVTNISDDSRKNAIESNDKETTVTLMRKSKSIDSQPAETNVVIENVESQEPRNDFIIENATSQEIKQNCVEEIFIENVNSQEIDDITLEEDLVKNTIESYILDKTLDNCDQSNQNIVDDMRVDEVSSPEISSYEHQIVETKAGATFSEKMNKGGHMGVFDSSKKRTRKNKDPMNLVNRLERLLNREKSDTRMWQYEFSKISVNTKETTDQPGIFCVKKMWKEISRLIVICSLAKKNPSNYKLGFVGGLNDFGIEVSNTVIAVVDPEDCPKSLTYSSVIKIHPPWEILYLQDCDLVFLLRPRKLEIILNDDTYLCKDFKLQNGPSILRMKQFCSCIDACDCCLPEGYLTVIQPLLSTDIDLCNFNRHARLRNYDEEFFKSSRCINDVILKHRFYVSDYLFLDLRVIHMHKSSTLSDEFWYLICEDEKRDICCVVVEGSIHTIENLIALSIHHFNECNDVNLEEKMNRTTIDKKAVFRFIGITPWKWIPAKSVHSFMEFVKFINVFETEITIGTNRLCVFVMLEPIACIERII